jgi:hypothetical protein
MKYEKYELESDEDLSIFEFESVGPNGRIKKIIQFSKTNRPDIYNLGFGDLIENSDEVSDTVVSNNKDIQRVLATVVWAGCIFTKQYPHIWIYVSGSTESRTRLYRIAISNHLQDFELDFEVFGMEGTEWKPFKKNINYRAFLFKRKILILKHDNATNKNI